MIPFLKDGAALQVFVKCNLIRHKLEVYATNKETFSIRNGMISIYKDYLTDLIVLHVVANLPAGSTGVGVFELSTTSPVFSGFFP